MKTLVVYESMYGNTRAVAQAIADGMGPSEDVQVVEVAAAPLVLPVDVELLVVGGPTHVHGMSRRRTRADAALAAERPIVSQGDGVREWTELVSASRRVVAASFDTRVPGPELLTGSAAKGIAKHLASAGFEVVDSQSFVLDGAKGEPYERMDDDELERARSWGRALVEDLLVGAAPARR
jgi:flavorubredoxin